MATRFDPALVTEIANTLITESETLRSEDFKSATERSYYGRTPHGSSLGTTYYDAHALTLTDLGDCRGRMLEFADSLKQAVDDAGRADDDIAINFHLIGKADRGVF